MHSKRPSNQTGQHALSPNTTYNRAVEAARKYVGGVGGQSEHRAHVATENVRAFRRRARGGVANVEHTDGVVPRSRAEEFRRWRGRRNHGRCGWDCGERRHPVVVALERADLDRVPLGSGVAPDADVVVVCADEDAVVDADDGIDP